MIEKQFAFPEYFINKIPKCDDCVNTVLLDTGARLISNPPLVVLKCPKCNKEYNYNQSDLEGEWKFRVI